MQGDTGEGPPGPRGPPGPPGPPGPGSRSVSQSVSHVLYKDCLDQSLTERLISVSDICGYGRFRIPRFGVCAGETGEF